MINQFRGETRWLSNFHENPITYEGITYPTAEHAFQAAKVLDETTRKMFAALPKPGDAKRMGMTVRLRPNWDAIKIGIMEDINRLKFQDPALKAQLLATGDQELVEGNNWNDQFWGVCEGVGCNHLGRILMKVRKELKCN